MTEVDNGNKYYFSVISYLKLICKKVKNKQREEKVPTVMAGAVQVISINDSISRVDKKGKDALQ